MEYRIEKNVPLPGDTRGRGRSAATLAFDAMEVGDSIVGSASDRSTLHQHAKKVGRGVAARIQADGTYRLWRTK